MAIVAFNTSMNADIFVWRSLDRREGAATNAFAYEDRKPHLDLVELPGRFGKLITMRWLGSRRNVSRVATDLRMPHLRLTPKSPVKPMASAMRHNTASET
jgi:hypothetical protein